ncbi:MAG: ribosome biogenesis GTP-binding protein YihA/YsxC [Nitrospirota bacterium]
MKILSAEFVISAVGPKQFPQDGRPQIAIAGRSNVGKSSIINSLLHRKNLVKTSQTPGKTQLINFFIINGSFYFVDLPGYGYARVPHAVTDAWAPMIEGYLKNSPRLSAVVVLLDCRREPDERDVQLIEWLRQYDIPVIFALTKIDKLNRQETERARRGMSLALGTANEMILTSAKGGQGIKELWSAIIKKLKEPGIGTQGSEA